MGEVHEVQLSLTTLTIVFVVPFLYFGYHTKYWYDINRLKKIDFILIATSILLSLLVVLKLFRAFQYGESDLTHLTLLHLGPLVLTILIIKNNPVGNRPIRPGTKAPADPQGGPKDAGGGQEYRPLNAEIQKLGWSDIVINQDLKEELQATLELLKNPQQTQRYGIEVPKGILLTGPPGTGKTTIAKVMANDAQMSFFILSMDAVVSKWVGESEKNLTRFFKAAQAHAPSIIFIDEVDTIGRGRSSGGQQWAENLLNHLLQLIDGVIKSEGIYVIAATNRADLVDSALKRGGRLNKVIEVPLPDVDARRHLFQLYLQKLKVEDDIDLDYLAQISGGKSAADISAICNQAGLNAFKREAGQKNKHYTVSSEDLRKAFIDFAQAGSQAV